MNDKKGMPDMWRLNNKLRKLLCGAPIAMMAACAQPYHPPEAMAPDAWIAAPVDIVTSDNGIIDVLWWRQFDDGALNDIMDEVIAGNHDLKIAQSRIFEARALADYPALLPEVSFKGNYGRTGGQSALGGMDAGDTRGNMGLAFGYDVDLSGKIGQETAARETAVERMKADYDHIQSLLFAEVAYGYADYRFFQEMGRLTARNIELQKETLRVIRLQHKAGATGQLDAIRAESQVLNTQAKLPDIESSAAKARNRLSVLCGKMPGGSYKGLDGYLPIPVVRKLPVLDAPASVIARRPDIRAAEMSFKEAVALKNVSTAELFPSLSLAGFFGLGTSSFYGASAPWSLLAGIVSPILDFGRIESRIDAAEARKQQALLRYEKAVLMAVEDVENELVSFLNSQKVFKKYQQESERRNKAVAMARVKFDAGEIGFLDVLNEEEKSLVAQTLQLRAKHSIMRSYISLHKALALSPQSYLIEPDL